MLEQFNKSDYFHQYMSYHCGEKKNIYLDHLTTLKYLTHPGLFVTFFFFFYKVTQISCN